jgi:hypothetical protein
MPAHAILQASRFETPLAAKSPPIIRALSLAGICGADGEQNDSEDNQQQRPKIPHPNPPSF